MSNSAAFDAPNNSGSIVAHNFGHINNHFNSGRPDDDVKKCLDALFVTDPTNDRSALTRTKGNVVPKTCDWNEQHASYLEWSQNESELLWIVDGPRKGKTMLAVRLTKRLEQLAEDEDMTFAYFFCDYRARERNSACAVLRTILWQLITKRPTLVKHAQQCIGEKQGVGERPTYTLGSRDAL